jgi:CDP-paratose 2-epimerase
MSVAIVTGSAGLVGSEAVRFLAACGMDVVGIDNNMRAAFFGPEASTEWNRRLLEAEVSAYRHLDVDIRDERAISQAFRRAGRDTALVIHAAAQPSHDWAARDPAADFSVNASGTLVLLQATRKYAPDAVFVFMSTNKVYGDTPNRLPLRELATRYEIERGHAFEGGIDESMSVDASMHSLFGASKLAADVLVQEYGKYFGMKTGVFRGGCITGSRHAGTALHGFLAYLMKCAVTGRRYQVLGYQGKQVRDNIHAADLASAFFHFFREPRAGEVYNIGGGPANNCSMLEAITLCQDIAGRELEWEYVDQARRGDHKWWVSSLAKFKGHYPGWSLQFDLKAILDELLEVNAQRWLTAAREPERVG